jgi:hypothetical protein
MYEMHNRLVTGKGPARAVYMRPVPRPSRLCQSGPGDSRSSVETDVWSRVRMVIHEHLVYRRGIE